MCQYVRSNVIKIDLQKIKLGIELSDASKDKP